MKKEKIKLNSRRGPRNSNNHGIQIDVELKRRGHTPNPNKPDAAERIAAVCDDIITDEITGPNGPDYAGKTSAEIADIMNAKPSRWAKMIAGIPYAPNAVEGDDI